MTTPGVIPYDITYAGKYYLRELAEKIVLEESLDEVAMRGTISLAVTPDLPAITVGQGMAVAGRPFGATSGQSNLFDGVIWEARSSLRKMKHLDLTVYDRTIYLARSEDEYLFNEGMAASAIIKRIASDWKVPVGSIASTGIPLAKKVFRARTLYEMMFSALKETAAKGGGLYRLRMSGQKLELVPLGSNTTVWKLETDTNIEELIQSRTLEGTVTKVKVLGAAIDDERSPQLAVVTGETGKYGTLQRVLIDEQLESTGQAKTAGEKLLAGLQETFSVTCVDINTVRAGDAVELNGMKLIVAGVRHELGSPGHMVCDLASADYVRRKFYAGFDKGTG